jgi:hypothetical protein
MSFMLLFLYHFLLLKKHTNHPSQDRPLNGTNPAKSVHYCTPAKSAQLHIFLFTHSGRKRPQPNFCADIAEIQIVQREGRALHHRKYTGYLSQIYKHGRTPRNGYASLDNLALNNLPIPDIRQYFLNTKPNAIIPEKYPLYIWIIKPPR